MYNNIQCIYIYTYAIYIYICEYIFQQNCCRIDFDSSRWLDGHQTNTSSCCMDQHTFLGLQLCQISKGLKGQFPTPNHLATSNCFVFVNKWLILTEVYLYSLSLLIIYICSCHSLQWMIWSLCWKWSMAPKVQNSFQIWHGSINEQVESVSRLYPLRKISQKKQGIKDSAAAHTALYYSSETSSTVTKITGMQHAWQHNILPWSFDLYTCTVKTAAKCLTCKRMSLYKSVYLYSMSFSNIRSMSRVRRWVEQGSASTSNTHLPHRHNRNETSSQNKNISTNYSIIFHSTHIQPQKHLEFSRFKILEASPQDLKTLHETHLGPTSSKLQDLGFGVNKAAELVL